MIKSLVLFICFSLRDTNLDVVYRLEYSFKNQIQQFKRLMMKKSKGMFNTSLFYCLL